MMEALIFGFVSYFGFTGAEKLHEKIKGSEPQAEVCEADEEYVKRSGGILSVTLLEGEDNVR
jgi:hypothetical protein